MNSTNQKQRNKWLLVAEHEILVKLTDKAWVISTLLSALLTVGIFAATAFFTSDDDATVVAVTTPQAAALVDTAASSGSTLPGLSTTYTKATYPNDTAARQALTNADADLYLTRDADGPWRLVSTDTAGISAIAISQAVKNTVLAENARAAGTTTEDLNRNTQLRTEALKGSGGDKSIANIAGLVIAGLFYMTSLVFGLTIAQSVLEEKQSRLAEIIVTAIPMQSLLMGKAIGNSVLAFMQILLHVIIALVGLSVTDLAAFLPSLPSGIWWFLAFFLTGFGATASMWAVAGSLASRQEDLGHTSSPMSMIMLCAFMVPLFAKGAWLTAVSYVPILSSVAMPMRVITGTAAWWEPLLSIALTIIAALLLIRLAARLYRNSLLVTSGRLTYLQALKTTN
ncbi:ABC transporter permease [Dermatophilus congolensis]|uniref:ABC transporter permease n=1 Tax=Dermatophilus congolensis TaxID=1863 RepID=UPI001AAF4E13|nr:ABC transporter permease [Dermatophilus congolensis]MBO3143614.1 ABC transporter permease [Dermatophilus congolensis]MBO3152607.1 ABC transporter permease [Dermatophilus congolensis]MBO3160382.1 ABC transporter permease [Dermatophilus congolensis]MBO3163891.1 ABC transporter permease [Dermatophilus congolensis]MBO3177438.1 ABC transporter permease [Dermatophilus congolensis]